MRTLVSRKVFFTWTLILALVSRKVKSVDYGDPCTSHADCNGDGLTCYDICTCGYDTTFYDSDAGYCIGRVNNGATCDDTKANEKQCYDNAHCVVNQAGEKKCVCKPGYTQVDETTCSRGSVAQKIDVFLICMIYLMGVFIYRIFL